MIVTLPKGQNPDARKLLKDSLLILIRNNKWEQFSCNDLEYDKSMPANGLIIGIMNNHHVIYENIFWK